MTTARKLPWTAIGLVALPIAALYFDDWVRLVRRWWSDPDYTHGFFVPLFSLYFLWEARHRLAKATAKSCWLGLPVILLGVAVKLWTLFFDSPFVSCVSMVVVILGAVLLASGAQVFRQAAVPILFLILMMPLPTPVYNRVALPLRQIAATIATTVLQGAGIPALQEGNVIQLPDRSLEVAEACSGMRSLTGVIALGVAFAYLCRRPLWERIALVASTIPIAVLTNAARVTATAFLAHWGFKSLVDGPPHAATALVLFAVSALVLWAEYCVLSHLFIEDAALGGAEGLT